MVKAEEREQVGIEWTKSLQDVKAIPHRLLLNLNPNPSPNPNSNPNPNPNLTLILPQPPLPQLSSLSSRLLLRPPKARPKLPMKPHLPE